MTMSTFELQESLPKPKEPEPTPMQYTDEQMAQHRAVCSPHKETESKVAPQTWDELLKLLPPGTETWARQILTSVTSLLAIQRRLSAAT